MLATRERTIGRGRFHYTVSVDELGGLDDGSRHRKGRRAALSHGASS